MSVRATPLIFVGKKFDNQLEAIDYLYEHKTINKEEKNYFLEQITSKKMSLEECFDSNDKFAEYPTAEVLDYMNNRGFFMGYIIGFNQLVKDPNNFLLDIETAKETWFAIFGDNADLRQEIQIS
jgi:hypothetical protein